VNKGKGEGESLTWLHVDSDNAMHHHSLDDMPGHLPHIPWKKCVLTWCCHVVIIVGVCIGGGSGDAVGQGGG